MKKVYLLFFALLGLLFSTATFAQSEFTKLKTIQIGEAVSVINPDAWYFMYQGRNTNQASSDYTYLGEGDIPEAGQGGILTDRGVGEQVYKRPVGNVVDPVPADENAIYAVKFLPVDGKEGVYNIMFGTGRYMTGPASNAQSSTFTVSESIYDAGEFNVYDIDPEQPGHIGFNVADYSWRVDNNGHNNNVVTWGSGKHETIENSNSIWSIHEVVWGEADEYEMAMTDLMNLYYQYMEDFEDEDAFPVGTDAGQYSEEAVNAFRAALDAAGAAEDPGREPPTLEEIAQLKQAMIDAYEAVIASKVPYNIPDGYYRIRGGMIYTNSVDIGEVDDEDNPITEERDVYKYLYSVLSSGTIYARWYTPDDLSTDCASLWKVTKIDGGYDIFNMATDARFYNVAQGTAVKMQKDSVVAMAIDHVVNLEDVNYVNIRVSTQAADNYYYLHQGGHSNGSGVSGNIVGWSRSWGGQNLGASEWTFEPVSQEEADEIIASYAGIKDHDLMVSNYKAMVTDAQPKLTIAKDISTEIFEDEPLITDVEQFSSPYTEESEGSIEALLDGDATTFWHSAWSGGNVAQHVHYLQVALPDATHKLIALKFTRRPVQNDHVTQWAVTGADDPDAEEEDWVELATFNTPYSSNTETIVSDVIDTQGKQYLRFYADATTNNRGYWHVSEFQLYPGQINDPETSQYKVMGAIATNLEKVITDQADIEDEDLSPENYTALKSAYDAFIAKFVDPAPLREELEAVKTKAEGVIIGTQPGFWTDKSAGDALAATVAAAQAYDKAGNYSPAQSESYIETLQAQADALAPAAIGIKTDKWYHFRFGTEAEFEKYGWSLEAGEPWKQTKNEVTYETSPALWGKYVTVAAQTSEDLGDDVTGYDVEPISSAEDAPMGSNIHLDEPSDIHEADMALFRFVAVGDSAYMIQNKATNLFIKAAGTSGATTLSIHPSLFKVKAIGYGLNVMAAESLTGQAQSYLHAQVLGNTLVTWNVSEPGTRSGFFIEEVSDVDANYKGENFYTPIMWGSINMYCYPTNVKAPEGMYAISNAHDTSLTLTPITEAAAGRPFIYINGDLTQYDAEATEADAVLLSHGYDLVTSPDTTAIMKGVFANTAIGAGSIIAEGNQFVVSKRSNTSVAANHAYIKEGTGYELEAEVTFTIDVNAEDGINAAIANVSRRGELYTIDGRLVMRNANLNSLRNMPKGIYILNGTKVTVK